MLQRLAMASEDEPDRHSHVLHPNALHRSQATLDGILGDSNNAVPWTMDAAAALALVWMKFFDQFKDFLVLVLIGAAARAAAIGDPNDALVIVIVIVLNAALSLYQGHHAEVTDPSRKTRMPG